MLWNKYFKRLTNKFGIFVPEKFLCVWICKLYFATTIRYNNTNSRILE